MEPAYNALFDFSHIRCIYQTNVMKHKNKFIRKKKTIGKQKNSLRYIFYKTCI